MNNPGKTKLLITGWFSFDGQDITAGDIMASEVLCRWLDDAGIPFEVAMSQRFGGTSWKNYSPDAYSHVIFVCGPLNKPSRFRSRNPFKGPQKGTFEQFLDHFASSKFVGLNVSLPMSLSEWNPFSFVLERDSERTVRPDLVFASTQAKVPVVGLIQIGHYQGEYQDRSRKDAAHQAIDAFIQQRELAMLRIDTNLIGNQGGLQTAAQIESMIAKTDVIITTRLHGLVFALKNGIPAVAIDAIAGGAKVSAQAKVLGWPAILRAEETNIESLGQQFDFCLTSQARKLAAECAAKAKMQLEDVRLDLLDKIKC